MRIPSITSYRPFVTFSYLWNITICISRYLQTLTRCTISCKLPRYAKEKSCVYITRRLEAPDIAPVFWVSILSKWNLQANGGCRGDILLMMPLLIALSQLSPCSSIFLNHLPQTKAIWSSLNLSPTYFTYVFEHLIYQINIVGVLQTQESENCTAN